MKVKAAVAREGDPTFRYEDVEIGPLHDNEIKRKTLRNFSAIEKK